MNRDLICAWLNLPAEAWPPDHYALLALRPGEADTERIEHQVRERMEVVRRYQLTHPEPATEAMNLIARAFMTLTDPEAKRAYDLALLGPAAPAVREPVAVPSSSPSWQDAPPPVRQAATAAEAPFSELPPPAPTAAPPPEPPAARAPAAPAPPADPLTEAARAAPAARRGLGTRRALYRRLAVTRRLARAWESAGKYLAWPKRRVSRPAEAAELIALLAAVREALDDFPPLLGEAGQPGYLVLSLARQPNVVPTFQTLIATQRAALARDWWAGRTFLQAHRAFLREELRTLRRTGLWARGVRAFRSLLSEHPAGVAILVVLLALTAIVWALLLVPVGQP
jgi:hypothetical protein